MKVRRGLAALAVAGLVGAGYVAYAASAEAGPAYRTAVATVGDVEQTMALSGSLRPADTADLQLGTSGKVAVVAVEEGEHVRAGQVVVRLDRTALRAAVKRANAQLTAARAHLESDRNAQTAAVAESTPVTQPAATSSPTPTPTPTPTTEPEPEPVLAEQQQAVIEAQAAASAALAAARTALEAQVAACTDPAAEGCAEALATVQAAQETVATAQDTLQAALDALTKTLAAAAQQQPSEPAGQTEQPAQQQQPVQEQQPAQEQQSTPTVTVSAADLARDQADIDQAHADLVAAQQALRAATVRAPHAGRIAGLAVAVGDRPAAGEVVASMVARGTTTVELDVTDTQVRQLETGQRASVTPAGTVQPLMARVTGISALPDTASGSTTYAVTVTLDRRNLSLPTGGTAAVDVVVGSAEDVVTVPASAVRDGVVTILDDGEIVRRPVGTGLVGATRIEVADGLEAGDRVVVADLDAALPSSEGEGETGEPETEFRMGPGGPTGPDGGPVVINRE